VICIGASGFSQPREHIERQTVEFFRALVIFRRATTVNQTISEIAHSIKIRKQVAIESTGKGEISG
jgi:hypothetical protein